MTQRLGGYLFGGSGTYLVQLAHLVHLVQLAHLATPGPPGPPGHTWSTWSTWPHLAHLAHLATPGHTWPTWPHLSSWLRSKSLFCVKGRGPKATWCARCSASTHGPVPTLTTRCTAGGSTFLSVVRFSRQTVSANRHRFSSRLKPQCNRRK